MTGMTNWLQLLAWCHASLHRLGTVPPLVTVLGC